MSLRPIRRVTDARPTLEGAGVHLRRAFGFGPTDEFDPFLLLDDFRNDDPEKYLAGFPWHPHRGIETITYVLAGTVNHADSVGNRGTLGAGDVQWMTAGRGILHQEMPQGDPAGRMHGFQLWANLPAALKMSSPRYQEVGARDIPLLVDDDGTQVRVICGEYSGKRGPVDGIAADPCYLDVLVPAGRRKALPVEAGRHAFAYVFEGSGRFRDGSPPQPVRTDIVAGAGAPPAVAGGESAGNAGPADDPATDRAVPAANRSLILFDSGDEIVVQAGEADLRFLLVSGRPLEEPVAWRGPIVMNTEAELRQAFADLRNGTFIQPG